MSLSITQIKRGLLIGSLVLSIFLPNNSYASNKFLTLPFRKEPELMQGWDYNFTSKAHQGIDYRAGVGTDLLATADGSIDVRFQPGRNFVYGHHIIINHGNGYKSLYAHLSKIILNDKCKRGEVVAHSGMSGTDNPHLHFEILFNKNNGKGLNRGHGWRTDPYDLYTTKNYYPPNSGYKSMGKNNLWQGDYPSISLPEPEGQKLVAVATESGASLSWDQSREMDFEGYSIYRSEINNGTIDAGNRKLIHSTKSISDISFEDTTLDFDTTYYYRVYTNCSNDRFGISNEVSASIKRTFINITQDDNHQAYPIINQERIFWEDATRESSSFPERKTLYFYDIANKAIKITEVGNILKKLQGPYNPDAYGSWACFGAKEGRYSDYNIYCHDFLSNVDIPITTATGHQYNPVISESGYVVWQDLRGGNYDIYGLNLNNAQGEFIIAKEAYNQLNPRIWKNTVIWKDSRSRNRHDLYLKNIDGGSEIKLAENTGDSAADIWESWAVWEYKEKISLINIETLEKTIITETGGGFNPRIRDGKVVYQKDGGDGYSYINVYDIKTSKTTKLNFKLDNMAYPYIADGWIAFGAPRDTDKPSSTMDIWMTRF